MEANRDRPKTNLDRHLAHPCSLCGLTEAAWSLADERWALNEVDAKGTLIATGRTLPLRALICKGCGAVRLVDEGLADTHL